MIELYAHNRKAYEAVMAAFGEGKQRACIVHATGTGKSYIIGALSEQFERVLVIAPMLFVLDETRKVCGENTDFVTYSSLLYNMPEKGYDLIVLDEFHRAGAKQWGYELQKLMAKNPEAKVFGATATPVRDNDKKRDMCDDMFHGNVVSRLTLADAMRQGILPMPKAYVCGLYSFDGTKKRYSTRIQNADLTDEKRTELRKKLNAIQNSWSKAEGVVSILQEHFDEAYHRRIIVFCPSLAGVEKLMRQVRSWFKAIGTERRLKYYRIDSSVVDSILSQTMKEYCEDEPDTIKLAFAVNMLNEGVHVPGVDCIICLRSTQSRTIMFQQLGRCLSTDGKAPLILDLVSNIDRLQVEQPKMLPKDDFMRQQSSKPCGKRDTEADEFPFEVIAVGKNMLRELDALNCDIMGWHTDEEVQQKVLELSKQYRYQRDVPKTERKWLAQFRDRFGAEILYKYLEPYHKDYYPKDVLIASASKFKSTTEWKRSKEEQKYYQYVAKHKMKADIYAEVGWTLRTSRSYEECLASARNYESYTEWSEKEVAIQCYARKKGWHARIIQDLFPDTRRRIDDYTKEECAEIALRYKSARKLRADYHGVWMAIKQNGWGLELCNHMSKNSLHQFLPIPTHAECLAQCREYKSVRDMRTNNYRLYGTIVKNHWEAECFSHFPRYNTEVITNEVFERYSKQCAKVTDLPKTVYEYGRVNKLLDIYYPNRRGAKPKTKQ